MRQGSTGVKGKKSLWADISLFFVAIFWGSNFVVMKEALELIAPFTYLGLRFSLASVLLAVVFWRRMGQAHWREVKTGVLVGFFLFMGFAIQTLGLLYTTPAKSGFITGMSVVMVPFFVFFVTRIFPGWWSVAGGLLATLGLFLLSSTGELGLEYDDLLTLIAAAFFAAHVVSLGIYSPLRDSIILDTLQLAFCGLASWIMALTFEGLPTLTSYPSFVWWAVIYAVIFCTIGAFVTQTIAQRYTPSTHAALILCLEAVFAGLFSYLFWGEIFTPDKILGALLILVGILLAELKASHIPVGQLMKKKEEVACEEA